MQRAPLAARVGSAVLQGFHTKFAKHPKHGAEQGSDKVGQRQIQAEKEIVIVVDAVKTGEIGPWASFSRMQGSPTHKFSLKSGMLAICDSIAKLLNVGRTRSFQWSSSTTLLSLVDKSSLPFSCRRKLGGTENKFQ